MEISHDRKFIFIHIPKTAGTSVAEILQPHAQTLRRNVWRTARHALPFPTAPRRSWFEQHDHAQRIVDKWGADRFAEYFSFGFVRNPFRHAVSHYHFVRTARFGRLKRRTISSFDFEEYLEWRAAARDHASMERRTRFVRMPDQSFYVTGRDGRILVTRIYRMEQLDAALADMTSRLNIPYPASLQRRRQQSYPDRVPALLTPHAVTLIRSIYARDFGNFGYSSDPDDAV